jgi:hypothetical protein
MTEEARAETPRQVLARLKETQASADPEELKARMAALSGNTPLMRPKKEPLATVVKKKASKKKKAGKDSTE